jgi:hypothetical protein
MNIKRVTILILTIIFVLNCFASCKSDSTENIIPDIKLTNVYKSQYFDQPEGYQINDTYYLNDLIYVSYFKAETGDNIVYKYNINGEVIDIIDFARDGYNNIIPSNDGTFYLAESTAIFNISIDGNLIWEFSLTDKYDIQLTGSAKLYVDYDSNYLYVSSGCKLGNQSGNILLVFTTTGEAVHLFHLDNYTSNIFKTPDGKIVIENNNKYYEVDTKRQAITDYEMPTDSEYAKDIRNVFYNADFSNEYDMYFTTNTGLYGNKSNSELLINWINSDIEYNNASWKFVSIINPETILCIYAYNELVLLTRIPDDEVVPKTIISIATIGSIQLLQTMAVKFNKQSDHYRVVIEDYSAYTDPDKEIYGDIKFNTDLMSGVVYDMIYFTGAMDTKPYITKDMFVDLYDVFEPDTNLLGMLRSEFEIDGHLYTLPVTYFLTTLLGKESQVGSGENLTVDDLISLPTDKVLFSCDRNDMLNYYLNVGVNDYIDFKNSECNFNDDSFIAMIELLKKLPVKSVSNKFYLMDEYEKIEASRNGDSYFMDFMVLSVYELLTMSYYYGDDNYVIKGFPNESGNGAILDRLNYISIVKNSPNISGSWEFMKFWLSDEAQFSQSLAYLPLTNSALEKTLDSYMNKHYYTNDSGLVFYDEALSDDEIALYGYEEYYFDTEDSAKIIRFFNNTDVSSTQNNTVTEIIKEELDSYFSDAITIEQCTDYIQNRVSTYLNEIS